MENSSADDVREVLLANSSTDYDREVLVAASPFKIVSAEPLKNQWDRVSQYRISFSSLKTPQVERNTVMSVADYNAARYIADVNQVNYLNATLVRFRLVFTPFDQSKTTSSVAPRGVR